MKEKTKWFEGKKKLELPKPWEIWAKRLERSKESALGSLFKFTLCVPKCGGSHAKEVGTISSFRKEKTALGLKMLIRYKARTFVNIKSSEWCR